MEGVQIIPGLVIRLLPKCRDQGAKRGRAFDQFLRLGSKLVYVGKTGNIGFVMGVLRVSVGSIDFGDYIASYPDFPKAGILVS
jgi:hypothetical protein